MRTNESQFVFVTQKVAPSQTTQEAGRNENNAHVFVQAEGQLCCLQVVAILLLARLKDFFDRRGALVRVHLNRDEKSRRRSLLSPKEVATMIINQEKKLTTRLQTMKSFRWA